MRARILFTNGKETVDIFWLSHDGKDVYCGAPGFDEKRSYHQSGKVHSSSKGVRTDEGWHSPLKDMKGQFHLRTIAFINSKDRLKNYASKYKYKGAKSDATLIIDSRSIPENVQLNIIIGLLEKDRLDVIQSFIERAEEDKDFLPVTSKQILISTAVNPWVYAMLFWLDPIEEVTP